MWRSVSGLRLSGLQVFSGKLQIWKDSRVIFWYRMQVDNSTFKVSSDHFIFLRFWFHSWREAPESLLNAEFGSVTSAVGSWKFPSFSLRVHCIHENAQSPVCFTTTVTSQRSSLETSMSSETTIRQRTWDMNHNHHPFDMLLADTTIVGLRCCASFKPRQVNSCVSWGLGVCKWLWASCN